ncbi:hypothetical protein FDECE_6595 [Fusarium decemcellulare]|nr:hypothetical protein FDECE_6595 [Fusarium decemcellulare]
MSLRLYNTLLRARTSHLRAPSPRLFAANFSRLSRNTPPAEIVQALKNDGCVVIKSMFGPNPISRINAEMDVALANTAPGKSANMNADPLPEGLDAPTFGENTKRLGDLLNASATWREEMIDDDVLHNVSAEAMKELGDYWLSSAQMIELGPGTKAQPLHADGAGWWPLWTSGEAWKPEFTMNFLVALTPTTKANGATGVVRGSHNIKYSEVLTDAEFGFWKFPDEQVEQIELAAGDCLILGGRVVHRGEENKTKDEFRRLLSCTVISSALTPEEAHPLVLDREQAKKLPERVKRFLGFRGQTTTIGPNVWQDHRRKLSETLGF